jgi:hypothetical protein
MRDVEQAGVLAFLASYDLLITFIRYIWSWPPAAKLCLSAARKTKKL